MMDKQGTIRIGEPAEKGDAGLARRPPGIELLTGADQRYFPGLAVATLSGLKSLNAKVSCRVTVIDGGLEAESRRFLGRAFDNIAQKRSGGSELRFVDVDLDRFGHLPKIWGYSAMTYARVLAPSLIDGAETIWVDADMIIYKDLWEISRTLRGNTALLAGARDPYQTLETDCPIDVPQCENHAYINCGLLWMNLARMREEGFSETLTERMEEWKDSLKYWDQTVLNCAALDRKQVLPPSYNELAYKVPAREMAGWVGEANLHLVTAEKPWLTPRRYRWGVRDTIFFKTFSLLGGVSSDRELETIARLFRWQGASKEFWKKAFYLLSGHRKRYRKWKERSISFREYSNLTSMIDARLKSWYES